MFIICEAFPPADPKMENLTIRHRIWAYYVCEVNSGFENSIDVNSVNGAVLEDAVAKASIYSHLNLLSNNGRNIKFPINANEVQEWAAPHLSLDPADASPKGKVAYTCNDEDIANTTKFLKEMMRVELNNHYNALTDIEQATFSDKKNGIISEINSCEGILDCQRLLNKRFDYAATNQQAELENLPSPTWDLSIPGLEVRLGVKKITSE
jgi:hypothetical protein